MLVPARRTEVISDAIAYLDLSGVNAPELASLVSDEAMRLLGGSDAVVWGFRPGLGRLLCERPGAAPASVEVTDKEIAELFHVAVISRATSEGVLRRLVEASFGVAVQHRNEAVLAAPLMQGSDVIGVLLVAGDVEWGEVGSNGFVLQFAHQAAIALLNHRNLQRAQRAEAELRALSETASELSSNLDLEMVLAAIVERARTTIHAPVAYVMLVDEGTEEIVMRVTAGTVTSGFARLRLKLGGGLGGQVAADQQTLYTSDYSDDRRFEHYPEVDAAVRNEAICSILGVPMSVGGRFVGVLFVADRVVRTFGEEDLVLLGSLAHHAASAIRNAELYERTRAAVDELTRTNRVVQQQNFRLQRAERLHAQLSRAILEGQELEVIVRLIAKEVGAQLLVFDHHHDLLADAGEAADSFGELLLRHGLTRAARSVRELRDLLAGRETGTLVLQPPGTDDSLVWLVAPIMARAEFLGSVWSEVQCSGTAESRILLEQATRVVALELLKERAVAEVHRRLGRELFDDLLSPRAKSDETLSRRAADLGVNLGIPHRIVRVAVTPRPPAETVSAAMGTAVAGAIGRQPWCRLVGLYGKTIVAVTDATCADLVERLRRVLQASLADAAQVRAVVSPPCQHVEEYGPQFMAAGRALDLLGDRSDVSIVDLGEAWVLTLLFRGGNEADLKRFVEVQLGRVLAYDEQHGLGLVETLEAYLDSERSPTHTAAALHVHVNTVYYRLEKLKALLGQTMATPRRALDLRIALLAHRLLSSPAGGDPL